jgi:hypothetical protein
VGGELWSVVHADERRRLTALGGQAIEHGDRGVGVDAPGHHDRQRLAGVLVDDVQQLEHAAVAGRVELEVERPDVVRALRPEPRCRHGRVAKPLALALPGGHAQALFAPDALDLLTVHRPALLAQRAPRKPVAPARMLPGQAPQPLAQCVFAAEATAGLVTLGRAVLPGDPARPPLRQPKPVHQHLDGLASARRAHHFPSASSRNAWFSSS